MSFPSWGIMPQANTLAAGAWGLNVDFRGAIVYDCLDNREYADQSA